MIQFIGVIRFTEPIFADFAKKFSSLQKPAREQGRNTKLNVTPSLMARVRFGMPSRSRAFRLLHFVPVSHTQQFYEIRLFLLIFVFCPTLSQCPSVPHTTILRNTPVFADFRVLSHFVPLSQRPTHNNFTKYTCFCSFCPRNMRSVPRFAARP
jgi:hypothetical protein